MNRFLVIGAGSWGTAFSNAISKTNKVTLYGRNKEEISKIKRTRVNEAYLPGVKLRETLNFTSDINVIKDFEYIFLSITTQNTRAFLEENKEMLNGKKIINLSKGIDVLTLKTISSIVKDKLKNVKYAVLSGPSHAEEVAINVPTAVVLASKNYKLAEYIQKTCSSNILRIYTSNDVLGVEISGALKNVIAIMIGVAEGLGLGDNSKAAIMTRGMNEIIELSRKMGAKKKTFMGLSGFGDLIVTCNSNYSRNKSFGKLIAKGYSIDKAINEIGMVVEGLRTLEAVIKLSKLYDVEMPLTFLLNNILYGDIGLKKAVDDLMLRDYKEE